MIFIPYEDKKKKKKKKHPKEKQESMKSYFGFLHKKYRINHMLLIHCFRILTQ